MSVFNQEKIVINLKFDREKAQLYSSPSQRIRILSEDWVSHQIYCPACGDTIIKYPNNQPVADFYCKFCREEFELKSKSEKIGFKIVDGAYKKMIERLGGDSAPNFFLLNYSFFTLQVLNFFVIPKYFFIPAIIEKRKPLSFKARRAGWVGCNILLTHIPSTGKIFIVKNGLTVSKKKVIESWRRTLFIKSEKTKSKGWILDIMSCIDKLGKKEFNLNEIYAFEKELQLRHPDNRHIRDKIRQQLQFLRDKGYLEFLGEGLYKIL